MGQRDILKALTGNTASATNIQLALDMQQLVQFEKAYLIAMSMPQCYLDEAYYIPTYRKIKEAYQQKSPSLMKEALEKLCIDIYYR